MAQDAFDLAERLQTPVFVMSDLDLGMNTWMSEPFAYPDRPLRPRQGARRGEAEAGGRMGPLQGRRRRRHSVSHACRAPACPAFFTRGSGHNEKAPVQRAPGRLRQQPGSLRRKFDTARTLVPQPDRSTATEAPRSASSPTAPRTGRSTRAAISCRREAGSRHRRICGCAPTRSRRASATSSIAHDRIYVVEQNRDAQMRGADADGTERRADRASCAACCTTTACRSTRDR